MPMYNYMQIHTSFENTFQACFKNHTFTTVESVIEVRLVFNFWILGVEFLLNKCPNFDKFLRPLFKSFFYSSNSTITNCGNLNDSIKLE